MKRTCALLLLAGLSVACDRSAEAPKGELSQNIEKTVGEPQNVGMLGGNTAALDADAGAGTDAGSGAADVR